MHDAAYTWQTRSYMNKQQVNYLYIVEYAFFLSLPYTFQVVRKQLPFVRAQRCSTRIRRSTFFFTLSQLCAEHYIAVVCIVQAIMVPDDGALWSHAHDHRFTFVFFVLSFFFVSNFRLPLFLVHEHRQLTHGLIFSFASM